MTPRQITISPDETTVITCGSLRLTIEAITPVVPRISTSMTKLEVEAQLAGRAGNVAVGPTAPQVELMTRFIAPPPVAGEAPPVAGDSVMGLRPGSKLSIARVALQDSGLWFVLDQDQRTRTIRRRGGIWVEVPLRTDIPAPADEIIGSERNDVVQAVLGEAEVGGWVVAGAGGESLHVCAAAQHRWVSFGRVEV